MSSNLWIRIEVDSGNAAVVDDPHGAVDHVLDQIRVRKPYLMDGTRRLLRDINGNRIGRYWIEFESDEEEVDEDDPV